MKTILKTKTKEFLKFLIVKLIIREKFHEGRGFFKRSHETSGLLLLILPSTITINKLNILRHRNTERYMKAISWLKFFLSFYTIPPPGGNYIFLNAINEGALS